MPDVAIPTGAPAPTLGMSQRGEHLVSRARVGDGHLPGDARRHAQRDVAVGVDEGGRIGTQAGERTVGDPALADAVEVEDDAALATDTTWRRPVGQPPAPGCRPGTIPAILGGQAGLEQRDVDECPRCARRASGCLEHGRERGAHRRRWRLGLAVERAELRVLAKRVSRAAQARMRPATSRRSRSARRAASSGGQATTQAARCRPSTRRTGRARPARGRDRARPDARVTAPDGRSSVPDLRRGHHPPDCLVRVTTLRRVRRAVGADRGAARAGPPPGVRVPPRG